MERGLVAVAVEGDGVDDVEFVDVAFFQREEEIAAGLGNGAAELEAVAAAAGGRRNGGEGIGGVEGAFAVGEKERAVNFGSAGFCVNLDAAAGVGRGIVSAENRSGAVTIRAIDALGGRALEFWNPSTVMRAAPGAPPLAAARIWSSRWKSSGSSASCEMSFCVRVWVPMP